MCVGVLSHYRLWRKEAVVRSIVLVILFAITMAITPACSKVESPTSPSGVAETNTKPTVYRILVKDFAYPFTLDSGTADRPSNGVTAEINVTKYPPDKGRFEVDIRIDQTGECMLLASTVQYMSNNGLKWLATETIGVDRTFTWMVPSFPSNTGFYGVGLRRLASPVKLTGTMEIYYIPN